MAPAEDLANTPAERAAGVRPSAVAEAEELTAAKDPLCTLVSCFVMSPALPMLLSATQ